MPTKRTLITYSEVKKIVAEKYGVSAKNIFSYSGYTLQFEDADMCGEMDIDDDTYLLQFDINESTESEL